MLLKITNDVVNKVKIENEDEWENSIFKESVYDKAKIQFENIIKYNSIDDKIKNNQNEKNNNNEDLRSNNIIAFTGERGSGKTSAMLSFENKIVSGKIELSDIKEYSFYSIKNIDPSIMNKNESIIEIVISEMFKSYKNYECKQSGNYVSERNLVNCFEKVHKDLKLIHNLRISPDKSSINGDNLEELIDMSSAISLHKNFGQLVKHYLNFISNNNANKKFLIITIDDLDLSISSAQLMMEEIRKFLMQPNIIILMAIKIEQLKEVLIQKNSKDLETYHKLYINSLENTKIKNEFLNEIENKSIKYLEKIIPYNKRIFMPQIKMEDTIIEFGVGFEKLKKFIINEDSIQAFIKRIYFENYCYFISNDIHINEIMPSTLREWIELFIFLNNDCNAEEKSKCKSKERYLENIKNIKDYYINYIANEVNSILIKDILTEFMKCSVKELNKKVLVYINECVYNSTILKDEELKNVSDIMKDIDEIHKREHMVLKENITIGSVITWIKLYENYINLQEELKIIEIIKLILSIRYLEAYFKSEKGKELETIANIIGRDFEGRYFELVRNKHTGSNRGKKFNRYCADTTRKSRNINSIGFNEKIIGKPIGDNKKLFRKNENNIYYVYGNRLSNNIYKFIKGNKTLMSMNDNDNLMDDIDFDETIEFEIEEFGQEIVQVKKMNDLLNMYFSVFQPVYQDQFKTRNSLLYRNEFNINDDWLGKSSLIQKYLFKPFDFLAYRLMPYDKKSYNDEVSNKLKLIILIININSFMEILAEFNSIMNNRRLSNGNPYEFLIIVVKEIIDIINKYWNGLKIENKDDVKIGITEEEMLFFKDNINIDIYSEINGYSLDYNDEGQYFLYYNWNRLQEIKDVFGQINPAEITEKGNVIIEIIKNGVEDIRNQLVIIEKRIKELSSKKEIAKYNTIISSMDIVKNFLENSNKAYISLEKNEYLEDDIEHIRDLVSDIIITIEELCDVIQTVGEAQEE